MTRFLCMRVLHQLFLSIALIATPTFAALAQMNFETGTWAQVLAKAKAQDKPIFVDFYAVWCGPCKAMAKNVFTDPAVGDFYNQKFLAYKIDAEKEEKELVSSVGIEAYPSLIYFDSDGNVIGRNVGALDGPGFTQFGQQMLASREALKKLPELKAKYEANPKDEQATAAYLALLMQAGRIDEAKPLAIQLLPTVPAAELIKPEYWAMINQFATDYNGREFRHVMANAAQFQQAYGPAFNEYMMGRVDDMLTTAIQNKDAVLLQLAKDTYFGVAQLNDPSQKPKEYYELAIQMFYCSGTNDWPCQFAATTQWIEAYQAKNQQELLKKSLEVAEKFKSPQQLAKAEEWSQKALALEDNAIANYAYAVVLEKGNKNVEAKRHAEIARDKSDNEELKAYAEELLGLIGNKK
jgi:thiol-disulfide isomerase/thioredoxin